MYCTNCGYKVPDGAAFCPGCGAALAKEQNQPSQPPIPHQTPFTVQQPASQTYMPSQPLSSVQSQYQPKAQTKSPKGMPAWAVILIITAAATAVCLGAYFLLP